jgi:hypothetical protein
MVVPSFLFAGLAVLPLVAALALAWQTVRRFSAIRRRHHLPRTRGLRVRRLPGHWTRKRLEQLDGDYTEASTTATLAALGTSAVLLVPLAAARNLAMIEAILLLAIAGVGLLWFGSAARATHRAHRQIWRYQLGLIGETITGSHLAAAPAIDAESPHLLLHDFAVGCGNVDHLWIRPEGIFAIETKMVRRVSDEPHVAQMRASDLYLGHRRQTQFITCARKQADAFRRWLEAHGFPELGVRPVLSLPGWFVEGDVVEVDGVLIGNPERLARRFREPHPRRPLSPERWDSLCALLETHNRVDVTEMIGWRDEPIRLLPLGMPFTKGPP